jgi:hypothetical protein
MAEPRAWFIGTASWLQKFTNTCTYRHTHEDTLTHKNTSHGRQGDELTLVGFSTSRVLSTNPGVGVMGTKERGSTMISIWAGEGMGAASGRPFFSLEAAGALRRDSASFRKSSSCALICFLISPFPGCDAVDAEERGLVSGIEDIGYVEVSTVPTLNSLPSFRLLNACTISCQMFRNERHIDSS